MMRRSLNNRPLRSVLANRKLFQGGGMVGMGNPMAMANMQPNGILASSQPLVDAVAGDAINPQGGPTLSMADGGIAKFHEGGSVHRHPHTVEIGLGAPPEAIVSRAMGEGSQLTEQQRAEDIFRKSNIFRGRLFDPAPVQPWEDYVSPEASPIEQALGGALGTVDRALAGLTQLNQDAANALTDVTEAIFTRGRGGDKLGQVRAVNNALRRQPDVTGASSKEVSSLISETAKSMITEDPYISGDDLFTAIGTAVYDRYELPLAAGVMRGRPLEDRTAEGLPATAEILMAEGPREAGWMNAENSASILEPAVKPPAAIEAAVEEVAPDESVDQMIARVSEEPSAETALFPPRSKPEGEPTPDEVEATVVAAKASEETLLEIANAAENRNVDRDMEFFKKRFIDSVGEYEGKTEYEKGLDFIKLGMAIAAGKSPNAVENISNGILATVDQFGVDEKEKREFNRKVKLSAVQYSLSNVAREEAQEESDRRKLYFFYDQEKKTDDNPYGELVSVSMEDILANDGKIPDNLREKDLVIKEIAAVQNATKVLREQLTENAELYRIGRVEEKDLRERLQENETAFISASVGNKLVNSVIGKLAANNITGIGNAGKELWRRALVAVGQSPDKKYTNIETARAEIRRAFQLLIPLTLGEAQTANSISNRDVEFLADAFVDEAFLKDGVLSFATISPEVLGLRLKGAMAQFDKAKLSALADYDDVLRVLDESEAGLQRYRDLGAAVAPGRFGREGLRSTLERVSPLAEQARESTQPTTAQPMQQVLGWTYVEDPNNPGTYRMRGADGTNFAGKFFDPSQLSELKLLPSE
jgi:hypothetical protein